MIAMINLSSKKFGRLVLLSGFIGFLLVSCGTGGTSQTPPSSFHASVKTADGQFSLQFSVTPNRLGTNTFTVNVNTANSAKVAPDLTVQLTTTMLDMDMGTDTVALQSKGNGQYSAQGELTMAGNWEIGILVRTADKTLHEAKVKLDTSG
jgi:copper transport protein